MALTKYRLRYQRFDIGTIRYSAETITDEIAARLYASGSTMVEKIPDPSPPKKPKADSDPA